MNKSEEQEKLIGYLNKQEEIVVEKIKEGLERCKISTLHCILCRIQSNAGVREGSHLIVFEKNNELFWIHHFFKFNDEQEMDRIVFYSLEGEQFTYVVENGEDEDEDEDEEIGGSDLTSDGHFKVIQTHHPSQALFLLDDVQFILVKCEMTNVTLREIEYVEMMIIPLVHTVLMHCEDEEEDVKLRAVHFIEKTEQIKLYLDVVTPKNVKPSINKEILKEIFGIFPVKLEVRHMVFDAENRMETTIKDSHYDDIKKKINWKS